MYVDLTIAVDGIKSSQKMVIDCNDAPTPIQAISQIFQVWLDNTPMTILRDSKCRPVVDISEMTR